MIKLKILIVVALIGLAGCSSINDDIEIISDVDPKVDFIGYETYAWMGSAVVAFDEQGQWEPPGFDADKEVKFYIDRELRAREMSEDSYNPDMLVTYVAGVDMDHIEEIDTNDSNLPSLANVPKAALVVVFFDAQTGQPIWYGAAEGDVQEDKTVMETKERLDYAVSKIMDEFPK
ncbi:DUF4136 domain-containing protein [Thalassotalea sp. PS06]|uniref:DUF4136 domain-containing protein n=1 Tax=Thalassotalea sp. PS06 TaxID=2594005 RepID=UPI0011654570|nr:DUF4136 domain-containing protein [Thalassotalea sp. PS06]QDP00820.1 DUF4136 domain-containing protein [Thalassotalea sp. PS06]